MSYYKRHIFFCTNVRDEGEARPSCGRCGSAEMRAYVKQRIADRGLAGPGGVRVNTSGCLDRCEEGPVAVVYPDAVWYSYVDEQDLDDIIEQHLVNGKTVDRLKI